MTERSVVRRTRPVVAIDGPAGAGKSTVARRVADELGYVLLDTGALYRCVGLAASRAGVLGDPTQVAKVALELADSDAIRFTGVDAEGVSQVALAGEDVSMLIRSSEAGQWASRVSAIPEVRTALLAMQRAAGGDGGVVMEGRDIGTVVFPDAEAKFFLTASVGERARRRHVQLGGSGSAKSLAEVESDVRERDARDSSRPVAPLACADDATLLDSTYLNQDEVVKTIVARARAVAESMLTRGGQ